MDLDTFRKNSVGHHYGMNLSPLLFKQKSKTNLRSKISHSEVEKDRQFFCSELVAKAFKVLNIFSDPDSKSSANYFPGSFAPEDQGGSGMIDEELKDDVALGPVMNILVNVHVKLNKERLLCNMPKINKK